MADPVSIATAACSGITIIDGIVKIIVNSAGGDSAARDFKKVAESLKAALKDVESIFKNWTGKQHRKLQDRIYNILELCESTLRKISASLPQKGVGLAETFANQVRDHFKSTDTNTRMLNLDRYMRILNTSLLTLSILDSQSMKDSHQSIKDSQGQILNNTTKISAVLAIEEDKEDLVNNLPTEDFQHQAPPESARGNNIESEADISKNIIEDWGETISQCISTFELSEDERTLHQQSLTPDIRSRLLSVWKRFKTGATRQASDPEITQSEPFPHILQPDRDRISETTEPIPPTPILKNVVGHSVLPKDDLYLLIDEYRQEVDRILPAALNNRTWYKDAASHQRHLIKLLEQRYEFYNEAFVERREENEKLADILIKQDSSESLVEASAILDGFLGENGLEPLARARIVHSLARIFFRQKWDKAEDYANEALYERRKHSDTEEHINESLALLIEIYENSNRKTAANAFKKLLPNTSQPLYQSISSTTTVYESQDTFNVRQWMDEEGFIPMLNDSEPGEPPGRRVSFNVLDGMHPDREMTPLQLAANEKHLVALDALISAGATLELADTKGATPLLIAASTKSYSAVSLLIQRGASVTAVDQKGDTALHRVQDVKGGTQVAEALLEASQESLLNKRGQMGRTALHLAAMHGNLDMARLLLRHKANMNVLTDTTLDTPLHLAIEKDHHHMVKYLLRKDEGSMATQLKNLKGDTAVEAGKKSAEPMRLLINKRFPRR